MENKKYDVTFFIPLWDEKGYPKLVDYPKKAFSPKFFVPTNPQTWYRFEINKVIILKLIFPLKNLNKTRSILVVPEKCPLMIKLFRK